MLKGEKGDPGEKGEPGDVTEEYRNLASQIAHNASDAQTSATNAETSASNAQKAFNDTKEFANQTKEELNQIKDETSLLKDEANTSAVNAKASENKAKEYADNLQASTDDISKLKEDLDNLKDWVDITDEISPQNGCHTADTTPWGQGNYISYLFDVKRGDRYKLYGYEKSNVQVCVGFNSLGKRSIVYIDSPNGDTSKYQIDGTIIEIGDGIEKVSFNISGNYNDSNRRVAKIFKYEPISDKKCLESYTEYTPNFIDNKRWSISNNIPTMIDGTIQISKCCEDLIFMPKGSYIDFNPPLNIRVIKYGLDKEFNGEYIYEKFDKFISEIDQYIKFSVDTYISSGVGSSLDSLKIMRKDVSVEYIESLTDDLKELKNIIGKYDGYYHKSCFEDEITDTVNKIENELTSKALSMIVTTDNHIVKETVDTMWKDSLLNMLTIYENCPSDMCICLGDMVNGSYSKAESVSIIKKLRNGMNRIVNGMNAFILTGNHDTNTFYNNMAQPILEKDMYSIWGRQIEKDVIRPNTKLYYYKDFEDENVRVVFLHSSMGDGTHGGQGDNWGYPIDECDWVRDVALNTTKHILFFSHMPLTKGHISNSSELPTNGDVIIQHCANFISDGGVVIGLIHGHAHADWLIDNGYFYECSIDCNVYEDISSDIIPSSSYAPSHSIHNARAKGTYTQDLFDYVIIKPLERKVNLIRFGAGDDREWSY